jgi:hypothetical protein
MIDQSCRELIQQIARMNKLGDMIDVGGGEMYPYQPDGCSDTDAQALYRLIDEARGLAKQITELEAEQSAPLAVAFRKVAKELREEEGDTEFDDHPVVSLSRNDTENDGGAYVAACVWIDAADAGLCRECYDPAPEGGDGWDGLCGNCAYKAELKEG